MPATVAMVDESVRDPRLLRLQVERAGNTIRGSLASSPFWVLFVAPLCSDLVGYFGHVPVERAALLLAIVCGTTVVGHVVIDRYAARDTAASQQSDRLWHRRLMQLGIALSFAWGATAWLLWDRTNLLNHVFIEFICLAMVARIVVNRSNHVPFFLATFVPMGGLLFLRCLTSWTPADLVLAAMVPLYAVQVLIDCRHISQRWDAEAVMRFSYEDISRQLEEARDEALLKRAEAEAANRSKTGFLANMSHELRTPLNAILGFSELIARECLGPVGSPRYKEYAGDIHTSGSHLLSLINDLLDVAKIEAGRMEIEPQMIETRRALDSALNFVAVKARDRRQQLSIDVEEAAAIVFADDRALKQVVINVASNAVKFTQEGGAIRVRARVNSDGDFELSVADNGPGIPAEKLDRIFKPFARLDNRYDADVGGTGLGLALVRGLVDLHGGRAWVESDVGKGTTVYATFPTNPSGEMRRRA